MPTVPLQVTLHLETGERVAFRITEEAAAERVLEQCRGGRLFGEPNLIVAGEIAVDVIATASLVRVDILTDPPLTALTRQNVGTETGATGQEVSEADWKAYVAALLYTFPDRAAALGQTGTDIAAYGRLSLRDGSTVHLAYTLTTPDINEQRRFLHYLFSSTVFAFARIDGGVSLLNPKHITHAVYYPGAEPPSTAWHAQSLEGENHGKSPF